MQVSWKLEVRDGFCFAPCPCWMLSTHQHHPHTVHNTLPPCLAYITHYVKPKQIKMKLSIVAGYFLLFSQQAAAFNVAPASTSLRHQTTLGMFGGAGAAAPKEDNAEESAQMEQAAKAMGMSLDEYTLAMNARVRLTESLDNTMVKGGKADTVQVERDLNNPAKTFEIKITDAGKALGQEGLSKELVAALKKSGDEARVGRAQAQKQMMEYIGEQMKKK